MADICICRGIEQTYCTRTPPNCRIVERWKHLTDADLRELVGRYREALERIERDCGDGSRPEDNAVQIASEALAATHDAPSPRKAER